ncbi:MAG: hypothetical protein OXI43_08850 [Candidatus Poribacteria bacterium]|nr:hypothetical protein [Candidatus Poribacteria bacterium]
MFIENGEQRLFSPVGTICKKYVVGDTYRPYGTEDIYTSHIYKHIVPTGLKTLPQRIYPLN